MARVIAAIPGIPDGRVAALREAFKKALQDPELQAKAKQAKLPLNFMAGEDVAKMVNAAMNQSPDVIKMLKDITTAK